MIAFKLILFAFLLTSGVLGRNTGRGSEKHKPADEEYKFNHPPVPESYEAIPVAIVYENEGSREEKSIKSDISQTNNFEQVNKELLIKEPSTNKKTDVTSGGSDEIIDFKLTKEKSNDPVSDDNGRDKPQPTLTTSSEQELQIPVAVVYEPESPYYEKTRQTGKRLSHRRRKIHRLLAEVKRIVEKEAINTSVIEKDSTNDAPVTHHHEETDSSSELSTTQKISKLDSLGSLEFSQLQQLSRRGEPSSTESSQPQKVSVPVEPSSSENRKPQQVSRRGKPTSSESSQTQHNSRRGETSNSESSQPQQLSGPIELSSSEGNQPQQVSIPVEPSNSESRKPQENSRRGEASSSESSQPQQFSKNSEQSRPKSSQPQQFSKRDNSTRQREVVPIVQSENRVFAHSGDFQYSYEGGDGTKAFEKGQLKTYDNDNAGEAVSGGFSYTAKDGNEYSLSYTADENGYRPVGAHLPTPPPIPPAIARALAYLATKTTPEPVTESIKESD